MKFNIYEKYEKYKTNLNFSPLIEAKKNPIRRRER